MPISSPRTVVELANRPRPIEIFPCAGRIWAQEFGSVEFTKFDQNQYFGLTSLGVGFVDSIGSRGQYMSWLDILHGSWDARE